MPAQTEAFIEGWAHSRLVRGRAERSTD
jgi:hypothetical protein